MRLHRYFVNAAHFAVHYILLIFPTAALSIEREWAMSYPVVISLATYGMVAFAVATVPAGWLGDRLPRNWLLATFFIGGGLATALVGFAWDADSLALGLVGIGVFAAIYHPVGLAMISDLSERQGMSLAVNGVWGNLGLAAAALATGMFASTLGWRAAFLWPGALILLTGFAYLFFFPKRNEILPVFRERNFREVAFSSQVRILMLIGAAALFGGLIFNGITVTMPKIMERQLTAGDLDAEYVGPFVAMIFAVAAFAQLPVGHCLDRFGARPVLLVLLGMQIVALLSLSVISGVASFALALILVTAMFAEIPVTSWLLARYVLPEWRSRAYSMEYLLSLGVSALIIPLVAGLYTIEEGFQSLFILLAGVAGVVWLTACLLPGTSKVEIER